LQQKVGTVSEAHRRCCGIDIHKDTIVICVLPSVGADGQAVRKMYGTFRNDLIRMRVWLKVTEIAMESTGVYWRPVWNVLEDEGFRLLLVNPAQVKALAGRNSDGRDAKRIAEYLQDGRLDGSFVPSAEVRRLRMMLRHRIALLEQRNEVHNQIRDLFETASIKLSSVVTDLMGVTGRGIVEALISGEDSPERLSWIVRGSLRKKEKLVEESLKGCFSEFHRTMLASHYRQYQFLTREIAAFEERIAKAMEPYGAQVNLLISIPGIDRMVAWHLLAELGLDVTVFPDAAHCCSWAGLVPGENESAGKQKNTRCRKGNKTLGRVLTQAAWAVSHTKKGYLRAFYQRMKARRGWPKAIVATAHKILTIAFHVLKTSTPFIERGGDYLDRLNSLRTTRNSFKDWKPSVIMYSLCRLQRSDE
jgi:transposase